MNLEKIKERAQEINQEIVKWRRYLHQHPETGFDLPVTEAYLKKRLQEDGIEVNKSYSGSGFTAVIRGEQGGSQEKTIAIRTDMDALNLQESSRRDYASKHEGKMHACGHDAHMAMTLGAARLLQGHRSSFSGQVKIIFQPAEEVGGGAKTLIKEGVLTDKPEVDAIIGTHIGNLWSLPSGQVGYRKGPLMAASDGFNLVIRGKGGHGARPQETVDALVVGAEVVTSLQNIVSRRIDPLDSAVVSIGEFRAGSSHNIIAEKAEISATVRSLNSETREQLPELIENVIKGVCLEMGADYELEYIYGPPVLKNDADFTDLFIEAAEEMLGGENVVEISRPAMGGEDMAFFLQEVPGIFFGLGNVNPDKGTDIPHHNPEFDVDEDVLWIGSAVFTAVALKWLTEISN